MSGTIGTYPAATQLGTLPPASQGSKQVNVNIAWATVAVSAGVYTTPINLLAQFNSGQFTTVQAVYIDNLTCGYELILTVVETGFRVRVGAFSAGMFPLVCEQAPQFTASLNAYTAGTFSLPPGTSKLYFFNTPQKPFTTTALGVGSNFQVLTNQLNITNSSTLVWTPTPAMIAAGQHLAITGINVTLWLDSGGTYSITGMQQLLLTESTTLRTVWAVAAPFQGTSTGQTVLQTVQTFTTPLIQYDASSSLNFAFSTPITGANMRGQWTMTYGMLTVS